MVINHIPDRIGIITKSYAIMIGEINLYSKLLGGSFQLDSRKIDAVEYGRIKKAMTQDYCIEVNRTNPIKISISKNGNYLKIYYYHLFRDEGFEYGVYYLKRTLKDHVKMFIRKVRLTIK